MIPDLPDMLKDCLTRGFSHCMHGTARSWRGSIDGLLWLAANGLRVHVATGWRSPRRARSPAVRLVLHARRRGLQPRLSPRAASGWGRRPADNAAAGNVRSMICRAAGNLPHPALPSRA
ncbi:MAG: hypothetical protein JSR21_09510 [Proteobacteria bacterium]|nr:hypothetical protein [Pseudomonadota bacterium]